MALVQGIDHVIVAVADLPAATATFETLFGLHVSGGGTHPGVGTVNRIVVLEDDYIELIAADPASPHTGPFRRRVEQLANGIAGYVLSTPDPDHTVAVLRSRGVIVDGPAVGRLEAGESFSRGWRTVGRDSLPAIGLPFLIKHDATGDERRRLLAGTRGLAPHAVGARRIAALTVAVPDLPAAVARYAQYFDLHPVQHREDPMLMATTATLVLQSAARIVLATPVSQGLGPVAMALDERGEGPFAMTIAVDDLQATVTALRARGVGVRVDEPDGTLVAAQLDHRQLHGVRIEIVAADP